MKPLPSLRLTSLLFGAVVLVSAVSAKAGDSIEKIPATPEDLARELGMELDKFEAKFESPVYATVTLTWKQPGETGAKSMKHSSPEPDQYHEILFVRKDFGQMQLKTGGNNARQVRDVVEMNVRFGSTGFFYRDYNPFSKVQPGQTLQSWSKRQSREPLPLDTEIPLVISAGPLDPGKPFKNLLEEYKTATAFVCLSVTFSRTAPPAAPETEASGAVPQPPAGTPAAPVPGTAPERK